MATRYERRVRRKRLRRWLGGPRAALRRRLAPLRRSLRPPDYGDLVKRVANAERNVRTLLAGRYPDLIADTEPRARLRRHEASVYSQNGEDGILLHLFDLLGVTDRRFIEFGIGNPLECNSTNLALNFGWSGLMIDGGERFAQAAREVFRAPDPSRPARVQVVQAWITPQNIDELFARNGFSGSLDLLSLDIDGNDYWVWQAIGAVQPRVAVLEYNASLGVDEALVTEYDERFDRFEKHPLGWYHGASLLALERLGRQKGYTLVGCESSGFNAFFVRDDVAKDRIAALGAAEAYYPDQRRCRISSPAEQRASLEGLGLVRV